MKCQAIICCCNMVLLQLVLLEDFILSLTELMPRQFVMTCSISHDAIPH